MLNLVTENLVKYSPPPHKVPGKLDGKYMREGVNIVDMPVLVADGGPLVRTCWGTEQTRLNDWSGWINTAMIIGHEKGQYHLSD